MNPDLSLINLNHGLCEAIEKNGVICFKNKHCRGYCLTHYTRLIRNGSVNLPDKKQKKCKFIDCDFVYYSNGYCKNHYNKWKRKTSNKKCHVVNCNKKTTGKYCSMHRTRLATYGTLEGSGRKKGYFLQDNPYITPKIYRECLAKDCHRNSNDFRITKGLCPRHYQRWRKKGVYEAI